MRYKHCVVSGCTSNAKCMPKKLFIRVPDDVEIRKKWFELARRDVRSRNCHICEDHFDLEKDMANYFKYKMGFTKKITMVDGVLPSKFHWQQGSTIEMCDNDAVISQTSPVKCEILVPFEEWKVSTHSMQECEENMHPEFHGQQAFTAVYDNDEGNLQTKSIKSEMQPVASKICQPKSGEILPIWQENGDLVTFATMSKGRITIESRATQEKSTSTEPIVTTEKSTQWETSSLETFAGLNLCRVCMEDDGTISLFSWEQDVQRCEMMTKCAAVEVSQGDGLPESICGKCAAELAASYQFALRCKASDKALRNLVKEEPGIEHKDNDITYEYIEDMQLSMDETGQKEVNAIIYNDHCYDHIINTCYTVQNKIEIKSEKAENVTESSIIKYEHNKKFKQTPEKTITKYNMRTRSSGYRQSCMECPTCKELFTQFNIFEAHMNSHIPVQSFQCDICKRRFKSKVIIEQHIRGHYGEKRRRVQGTYIVKKSLRPETMCSICGRDMSSISSLQVHILSHSHEKPFICQYCGRGYKQECTLKNHLQNAHADMHPSDKYICDFCGITVYSKFKMKNHMLYHMPTKWHKCKLCPKKYLHLSYLVTHNKRHTSKRLFKCRYCSWSFYEPAGLKSHYLVHTNERKFICNVCDKRFKTRSVLTYHMVSHSDEKPWVCNICGKSFSLKCNMTAHMNRVHFKKSETIKCSP